MNRIIGRATSAATPSVEQLKRECDVGFSFFSIHLTLTPQFHGKSRRLIAHRVCDSFESCKSGLPPNRQSARIPTKWENETLSPEVSSLVSSFFGTYGVEDRSQGQATQTKWIPEESIDRELARRVSTPQQRTASSSLNQVLVKPLL